MRSPCESIVLQVFSAFRSLLAKEPIEKHNVSMADIESFSRFSKIKPTPHQLTAMLRVSYSALRKMLTAEEIIKEKVSIIRRRSSGS